MTTHRPFALLALFFWLSAQALHAQPFFPDYKEIQPNNIRAWFSNHARAFQGINDNPSFFFPAESNKSAIFLSVPWVAAQFEGDTAVSAIRTAAVQNIGRIGTEYRPGKIRQIGSNSLGVDYNRTRHRIYYLRRGDNRENSLDFREYPVEDGAPTDVFGNPRILGSETMWSVASDVGGNRRFSQLPLGIELHQQVYGIPSDNPTLNNTLFIRNRFINRNIKDSLNPTKGLLKNAYFAVFSDDDLGDAGDDITGCDTITKTAYTYNGVESDAVYGSPPPAVGHVFLEGTHKGQPFDIYAYVRLYSSVGPCGDPESGRPDHIHNFLRGLDKNGNPVPSTEQGSRFMFSGDPVTGTGIVQTQMSDVRHVFSAGPVDMAAGDTVEVLYAVTIAVGTNRLNSVTRLKAQAAELQLLHRTNLPATKMWLYVNRGADISIGKAFPIVVEARDEQGFPRRVSQLTIVSVQLLRGNGTLSGTLVGTILPGQNSVTLQAVYQGEVDTVQFQARSLFGQMLAVSNSRPLRALQAASRAERVSLVNLRGRTNIFPNDTLEIQFAATRPDGTIDNTYNGTLRLKHFGNGRIVGDTIAEALSGIATARIAFTQGGMHVLKAENAELVGVTGDSIRIERGIVALKYPRVIKNVGSDISTLPFCALFELFGLEPKTTYRYRNTIGTTSRVIAPREPSFVAFNPPFANNLSESYSTFTTDNKGNYKGWFVSELVGQTPVAQLSMQIQLNQGGAETDITMPLANASLTGLSAPSSLLLGTQISRGTGLVGILPTAIDTMPTRRKIAVLYETEDSTARPLAAAIIEPDGLDATGKPQFYIDSVQSINGRFGTIIPNNLPNGIRRIEIYDLQGRLRASATSSNGVWNGTSSSNVSLGAMPLMLVFSGFRVNALSEEIPPKPLPTAFRLGQNYPNPFNPTTTIPIQVPRTERVVLKVFDVLGREVATLVNETLSQNEYLIPFNAGGLSSGVYFYRVQAGEFVETKKMMLVK
ncbi:MAG: T9SS type A sorting domain-containing protein [Chloroherpetonaceae bacterium]